MKTVIFLLSATLAGWLGGGTWYWVCVVKGHCDPAPTPIEISATEIQDFSLNYQDSSLISYPDNLRFSKSNANFGIPSGFDLILDSVATYLNSHPNQDLELTGLYLKVETPPAGFQDIGLARADEVRNYLLGKGVDTGRVINSSKMMEMANLLPNGGDSLAMGVRFLIIDEKAPLDNFFEPAALFFDYNSDKLQLTDSLRSYITHSIQYLNRNPDKTLSIVGHTDNRGTRAYNMDLGQRRANLIGSFFEKLGLSASQIELSSKGESAPIEPNDTEEQRHRNRRVEIQVQ